MNYYFTGREIVKVKYDHAIEETDVWEGFRTVGYIYKNIKTDITYYINKGNESSEIFSDKIELIKFKIKEFENEVVSLKDKISYLEEELKK